jgi:prepilin signal peptidase PulO-like enzyme (type II secretory pathway)
MFILYIFIYFGMFIAIWVTRLGRETAKSFVFIHLIQTHAPFCASLAVLISFIV